MHQRDVRRESGCENDTFALAFVNLRFSSDLKREDLLFCYSFHATAACGPFEYDGNHFKIIFPFVQDCILPLITATV